jgi:predicted transposase YbfD/YdcC
VWHAPGRFRLCRYASGWDRVRRGRAGRATAPNRHEEGQDDPVEVVYLITSDRVAGPEALAAWVRGHWHLENKFHWVRDVTYQEDKPLVRTGNAPRVMATLRSLAISILCLYGHANIAAAYRHHARDPQRILKLLQAA